MLRLTLACFHLMVGLHSLHRLITHTFAHTTDSNYAETGRLDRLEKHEFSKIFGAQEGTRTPTP